MWRPVACAASPVLIQHRTMPQPLQLGKKLGSGTFGDVFAATDAAGRPFAVKRIRCSSVADASDALQESFLMQKFQHPNIVEYRHVYMYEDDGDVFVCLSMDMFEEGVQCPPPPPARDALEGKGPQRRRQKRLGRRLEEVAEAVGGG